MNGDVDVRPDRVRARLYNDPGLFATELANIFYKAWVCVAHDSEVAKPGDFKRFQIGERPIVVNRDRNLDINVLLNRCRHRAATVCEPSRGEMVNGFTCPYHSWSYALDGRLRGVPFPSGYDGDMDRSELGLVRLRTESYGGLIFATFDDAAEPLASWLGNARRWIDLFNEQGAGYELVVQGSHQFTYSANWKIQLENVTDGYHFPLVHRSWMSSVDPETAEMLSFMKDPACVTYDIGGGHSVGIMVPEHVDLSQDDGTEGIQDRFAEVVDAMAERLPQDGVRRVARSLHGAGFNLNVFPNLALSMGFIRLLNPLAVDKTWNAHLALGYRDGPPEANRARLRIHEHFQGPFGFGTPDDVEIWERVQRGSIGDPDLDVMLHRGLNREVDTVEGPSSHITDETGMRAAYTRWKELMPDA